MIYILLGAVAILAVACWVLERRVRNLRRRVYDEFQEIATNCRDLHTAINEHRQQNALRMYNIDERISIGHEHTDAELRAFEAGRRKLHENVREYGGTVEKRFAQIEEGLGGKIWRTKEGHARWIALLSTEHLENILDWPNTSPKTLAKVINELERREIDAEYRETLAKPKPKRKTK